MMDLFTQAMNLITQAVDVFLHVDVHLNNIVSMFGAWTYVILFLIIFCETGLVVTPFLPGDSLLFAAGAITALDGSPLNVAFLCATLLVAAILGDGVNYLIGAKVGETFFRKGFSSRFFNESHLKRTQEFFERHGGKTVVIARFAPIIRTYAPFVAGVSRMQRSWFTFYNVVGALAWVLSFTLGGYFLGNIPSVKRNFHIIIVAIIVISVMPAVIELLRARLGAAKAEAKPLPRSDQAL